MTSDPALETADLDPRLTPFLPMVYVAWADGDLAPHEIRGICDIITGSQSLDHDCRLALGRWLDPDRPPSAEELQNLLDLIQRSAAPLESASRRSLTDLGREIARLGGSELGDAERAALEDLERALGLTGDEAARRLLVTERPAPPGPADPAADLDVSALSAMVDGDHRSLRIRLREVLSSPAFAHPGDLDRAAYREHVLRWCRDLAGRGFGAHAYPVEYGGEGDLGAMLAAFETLATHDLSLTVKFGVQFGLFGGSIHQLGTAHHHERYLRRIASLELPGCFAMTETGHGSNVAELETVARYDRAHNEFVIQTPTDAARKDYIGNAACHGRLATVFAQLEVGGARHGVHAFVVPIRDGEGSPCPGVRIEDCGAKLGLEGVDNGRLWFDQVRIPRDHLLDRFGRVDADGHYSSPVTSPGKRFFQMLGTLVGGRVSVALGALSATKAALAIAVRYGGRRRQFGPEGEAETLLLDYPTHQRRLLPRLARTYGLHFALQDLARRFVAADTDHERREVETLAAGLKAAATWHATDTIQACREACGGQGYLAVNRFASLKADTDVFTTFEGDNTVLLQLVAKSLLSGYARQFGDLDLLGLVRYFAGRASDSIAEHVPLVTVGGGDLEDPTVQLAAFRWREDHLLASLARRLKKRIDGGTDSFVAFIECQNHAVATARAHVDRRILEAFSAAVDECPSTALVPTLTVLRNLHALSVMEGERGWFLEHGYLDRSGAADTRRLVTALSSAVRPVAIPLVDAFGIPAASLAAPIAFAGVPA